VVQSGEASMTNNHFQFNKLLQQNVQWNFNLLWNFDPSTQCIVCSKSRNKSKAKIWITAYEHLRYRQMNELYFSWTCECNLKLNWASQLNVKFSLMRGFGIQLPAVWFELGPCVVANAGASRCTAAWSVRA
jgi:hypothetical protein